MLLTIIHKMFREWLSGLGFVHVPVLVGPNSFSRDVPFGNGSSFHTADNNLLLSVNDCRIVVVEQ